MKTGPLVLIEDDFDDKHIFEEIFKDLKIQNELIWFDNCFEAMKYLKSSKQRPFLILCDVNIPVQNGIEFKRQLDNDPILRKKSIPFVFYSTSVNQQAVNDAYSTMTVQGFFEKGSSIADITRSIKLIIDYWLHSKHPNLN